MATEQGVIAVIRAFPPTSRGSHDRVAYAIHSSFLAAGYILIGAGYFVTGAGPPALLDDVLTTSSADGVMINGWNQLGGKYAFVYLAPGKGSNKILVKCSAMSDTLFVEVLKNNDQEPLPLEISVNNYTVKNGGNNYSTEFKDLGKLVSVINKGILGKLRATSESSLETAKSRNISRIINHISKMSWADLPVDILFIIFGFLHDKNIHDFLDLYQCLAVCHSWRSVAKQIWQTRILPTTPWLLFHVDQSKKIFLKKNLYKCHEYSPSLATTDNDASFSCPLNLLHFQTYASYDGWLLLGNTDNLPFLYNPITSLLLPLPPLPPLPQHCFLQFHMKFVSSGASPTNHNCIICIKFSNKRELMDYDYTSLAFCRPAVSTSWVVLQEKAEDVIFSGGNFYTIGSGGDLFVYNSDSINGNTSFSMCLPWKVIKMAEAVFNTKSLPWYGDCCCCFYLVESKDRELLMIMRTVDRDNYFTKSFRIFKLNPNDNSYNGRRNHYCHYYWKEINSLPIKESIILLWNEAMCISVDDHNGYKPNSIYFYDEERWGQTTTYGIYDLGSCKINHKTEDADCHLPSGNKGVNILRCTADSARGMLEILICPDNVTMNLILILVLFLFLRAASSQAFPLIFLQTLVSGLMLGVCKDYKETGYYGYGGKLEHKGGNMAEEPLP
ncbi:hypothetical protein POM88_052955 [Heracleum sosnowskyi]|uniref:F-box domain-containing protein n=1 Tax=Heracleum sosnowskyi TaxID=360622 RepID=A0AAD8LYH5_9APIA|nr:hypothetical protein POM88_052955 [Heracleum sosnowskyi]